jgi:glycosyltransferase involved in cell wall biosynthesis
MNVAVFLNTLGLGGTEKAACRWAWGLQERGHRVVVLTLQDGPRRADLELRGVPVRVLPAQAEIVAMALREIAPDMIHAHAPGHPHVGDVLGAALASLPKIPVVQTNIFGQLHNPKEDAWTDFRLFISWTSCVQAARRAFRKLDENFFRNASVAVYPLDPVEPPPQDAVMALRRQWGVRPDEVLFGRFSRPDPNKWTDLALDAFCLAVKRDGTIKLLLREPPAEVANRLRHLPEKDRFVILAATNDAAELKLNMAAVDVVLHTSSIGESFGYGIAEPMSLGKPVVTHSVPWADQAQIELVRHGECGFVASTPRSMARRIADLARSSDLRVRLGRAAQKRVGQIADPDESIGRLEAVLNAVTQKRGNPRMLEDVCRVKEAADNLNRHQFGHEFGEWVALRPFHWRVRLHQLRRHLFNRSV